MTPEEERDYLKTRVDYLQKELTVCERKYKNLQEEYKGYKANTLEQKMENVHSDMQHKISEDIERPKKMENVHSDMQHKISEDIERPKKLEQLAKAARRAVNKHQQNIENERTKNLNARLGEENNEDFQNAVDMHNVRDMWKRIKSRYLNLIDGANTMKEKMKIMKAAKDKIHSVHLERYWNKFLKYAERKMKENAPKKEKSTVRSAQLNEFVDKEGVNMPDKIGHELVRAFGSWNITFIRQDFRNMAKMGFRRMTRKRKGRRINNEARNTVNNPMRKNNNPFQEVIPISNKKSTYLPPPSANNKKSTYLPPPSANNKKENEWNTEVKEVEEVSV
jgi:hypothetical protein